MPNIFNHGQKDGLQLGWLVLPSRLSSSKHSARPAVAVVRCFGDRNAPTKQPLFDYRPQDGLELQELLLLTLKVQLRRCLRSPDQSINYYRHKSEQKHRSAFAAAAPHIEGAMAATLVSSSAPQQADQEFEVMSNSWCYNLPCHEGSQKEFCRDPVIKCRSSIYSEEGHPVDTKQSRNSALGRWHTLASIIQQGEARLEQRRLKTLWRMSRSQNNPSACQPVRALPETVGNRPATPSDDAGSSGQTTCLLFSPDFIQRSPRSSPSKNVFVKIQFKSPSDTLASDPTHWSVSSLIFNYRTLPQFPKVSTRRVQKNPADRIATFWPSTIAVVSSSSAEATCPPQRLIFFTVLIGCTDIGCAWFTSKPWPQVAWSLLPSSSVPSPRILRHLFRRP